MLICDSGALLVSYCTMLYNGVFCFDTVFFIAIHFCNCAC